MYFEKVDRLYALLNKKKEEARRELLDDKHPETSSQEQEQLMITLKSLQDTIFDFETSRIEKNIDPYADELVRAHYDSNLNNILDELKRKCVDTQAPSLLMS
jgi:hypothetical protein